MKKVFLSDLPRYKDGPYTGRINWKDSVGNKVKFIYKEICGYIEIMKYIKKNTIQIKYDHNTISINTANFSLAKIGNLIEKHNLSYKYNRGDLLNNLTSGAIKILKQIRIKDTDHNCCRKGYIYECIKCGNVDKILETNLNSSKGCNVCGNRKILKGYNDIWTTNSEVAELIEDPKIGFLISNYSNLKTKFRCPNCNLILKKKISDVSCYGLSCPRCSDGISYPEKFMFFVLEQLKVDFECQKTFEWSNNKKYDFFISDINCIIETHGSQHYEKGFENLGGRNLESEVINDLLKKRSANENSIKYYVIVDSRKSELVHMKNSILNSELSNLFNLDIIDWHKCHKSSCSSLVKKVSDLWLDVKDTKSLSDMLKIDRSTVIKYLKKGNLLGWNNYCTNEEIRKGRIKNSGVYNKKPIVQIGINNRYLKEFDCASEAYRQTSINAGNIRMACKGTYNTAGGYKWMYKEDYEKYIENINNKGA